MTTNRYQRVKSAREEIKTMAISKAAAPDAQLGVKLLALTGILVLGTIVTLDTKLIF